MNTATINGRSYDVVERIACGIRFSADLKSRGWDGFMYRLRGKRGACYAAFKAASADDYLITMKLGRERAS